MPPRTHRWIPLASLACILAAAAGAAAPPHTSTWIGNSFGGGYTQGKWVQNMAYDIDVTPDGRVVTASPWDEGKMAYGVYKNGAIWHTGNTAENGTLAGSFGNSQSTRPCGVAVAAGNFHLFAPTISNRTTVSVWNLDGGEKQSLSIPLPAEPQGLAVDRNEARLAVAVAESINVYEIPAGTLLTAWTAIGASKLSFETDGDVWAIVGAEVREYSAKGVEKRRLTLDRWKPTDLAFHTDGRLLVADNGFRRQIHYFSVSSLALEGSLGQSGGISAGVPGVVAPDKFWGITGVGCDAAGNITVALSEVGLVLRNFAPDGTLNWELSSLTFIDSVQPEPGADGLHIFGQQEHFLCDWNAPVGKQWRLFGYSLDSVAYPGDPRVIHTYPGNRLACSWIAHVEGRRYLYLTDMTGSGLMVYRFDGELAIPCAAMGGPGTLGGWQAGAPRTGNWFWNDRDGDGRLEDGEYSAASIPFGWRWWITEKGHILIATGSASISTLFPQGPLPDGRVTYSDSGRSTTALPPGLSFTKIQRTILDSGNDRMYVSGYTDEHPDDPTRYGLKTIYNANRTMGPVLARYDNWSRNPVLKWSKPLYYYYRDNWEEQCQPASFATAGDYLFVAYNAVGPSNPNLLLSRSEILALDSADGTTVYSFLPTPEVGGPVPQPALTRPGVIGSLDIVQPIHAMKRRDGEYLIFMEEGKWAKTLVYRWRPSPAKPTH